MVVSAVLAVVFMNGCGRVTANVEDFDMQQSFAGGILNEDVRSSDIADDEALSDDRDIRTGVVKENGLNAEIEKATTDEYDAGEKTQTLAVEHAAEDESEVTLIMVGDILLHTPVAKSGVQENGSYDFTALFANVKDEVEEADLALVNQEVIIGGEALGITGYPSFNAPYELGDALAEAGFDVVLHATNHTLDKGKKGLTNCLSFWAEQHP
ncbi:MAG: CapA family protein, partial [Lachnospiraceae bacterium]|nr:CapA family protein [Lachnospiraceae bacterium]